MTPTDFEQRSSTESVPSPAAVPAESAAREWSTRAFLGFLGTVTCVYAAVLIYHIARPPGTVAADANLLEQCRQICLKYGLVSTGNVRQDAEAFLAAARSRPLTQALHELLSDSQFQPASTQPHKLLQQSAPGFSLSDETGARRSLSEINRNCPTVVVFYLGYGCSHCVAQLLALDRDLHSFRELDAEIVAISSDSSDHTASRFREFGRFGFPVLSDSDNAIATQWGVFTPEADGRSEDRLHGTFVVDRAGTVIWAATGQEPFLDNRSLLHVIAAAQGLMPSSVSTTLSTAAP